MSELLGAALAYAAAGLHVFPCKPAAKVPACAHGALAATVDPERITAWWRSNADYNVAVATGEASALFVVDIDGLIGAAELRELEAQHGVLPETWDARTPNDGRHVGFAWPGQPVPNSVGRVAPNIDIRGQGGYVVVPPSRLACGKYTWSTNCADELADAPHWLVDSAIGRNGNGKCATATADWVAIVANGAPEGQRNHTACRLAGYLLHKYVDLAVTRELLHAWNQARCRPPLSAAEINHVVDSVAGREMRKRENG